MTTSPLPSSPLGLHRVIDPPGVLPQAAWRLDAGLPADAEVAIAKFWAAEAGHHVAHAAVHIHGGVGIDVTYPVHRYFTTAKRLEFAMGGATAQLLRLSSTW